MNTVADVLDAARRHGLQLTKECADFDCSGMSFLVVHARDDQGVPWIVRTPRRPELFESTCVEARLLRLLRPRLPVAVPDWRVHERDVIAYPRLDGTPAITKELAGGHSWNIIDPGAPPEAFIDSIARLLAALQAIDPETAASAGVPLHSIADVRDDLGRVMQEVRSELAPSEAVWARWHRWLEDDALWPQHVALAHGDLHPGHTLVAADGRVVGVLDWTEAKLTDPSMDMARFCGSFGRGALTALLRRFEDVGGRTWPRLAEHAAERWAAYPAILVEWALQVGHSGLVDYGRDLLAVVTAESEA